MEQEKRKLKTISVMLDASGTSGFIDDKSAQIFVRQLEVLRVQFGADIGTISISTSYNNPNKIRYILDTIARNLTKNIIIGTSFLEWETYDYQKNTTTRQEYGFNSDKVATFDKYYISNPDYDIQWIALIDDNLYDDVCYQYKETHPIFVCRPSNPETKVNFMTYDTETKDFDGVIEGLNYYIETIKDMTREDILNYQKHLLSHQDLKELIKNDDYILLKQFFGGGYANIEDCNEILELFRRKYNWRKPTKEELQDFRDILDFVYTYYEEKNDEMGLLKVNNFKKITEDC